MSGTAGVSRIQAGDFRQQDSRAVVSLKLPNKHKVETLASASFSIPIIPVPVVVTADIIEPCGGTESSNSKMIGATGICFVPGKSRLGVESIKCTMYCTLRTVEFSVTPGEFGFSFHWTRGWRMDPLNPADLREPCTPMPKP